MLSQLKKIQIRCARQEDCEPMLEWRNHPDTRRHSFDPTPLDPNDHKLWFNTVLANPSQELLIGEHGVGNPVGVVRFDLENNVAKISIYLVPNMHRKGMGTPLLYAAIQWLKENSTVELVHAYVTPANLASLKMFREAGFTPNGFRFSLELRRL